MASPLILTLALDPDAQSHFNRLRTRHFPPERNVIDAHLTLFHALDGTQEAAILADLARTPEPRFTLQVSGLRSLGHGVAITISSPHLIALRARLATDWAAMLTPQDRQRFNPHVTIQNKVPPAEARQLLSALQADFQPHEIEAHGLSLWHYLGGPWQAAAHVPFIAGPG